LFVVASGRVSDFGNYLHPHREGVSRAVDGCCICCMCTIVQPPASWSRGRTRSTCFPVAWPCQVWGSSNSNTWNYSNQSAVFLEPTDLKVASSVLPGSGGSQGDWVCIVVPGTMPRGLIIAYCSSPFNIFCKFSIPWIKSFCLK
jgi:hypothetical protein